MLVVCPKCFTQYVISNEIKVPEGQKFHCSACGNYFTLKSERQTGFYGDEAALEDEEIPTVSAVMNETDEKNTEVSVPTNTMPETSESESQIAIKNESNRTENTEPAFSDTDSLALLANETPQASDRLDTLPEAFKPVETKKKKTSALGAIFCLFFAGAICYGTVYVLKQYPLMELTEEFIASKLDKKNASKTQKEATSSPAVNTVAQPAAQSTPSAVNEKDKSENSADKPMYIPPAKLDKPIITVEEVSARQATQHKEQLPPVENESPADSELNPPQPTPIAPQVMSQQMPQIQKPTQLVAQQAKAQQQAAMPPAENEISAETAENTAVSEAQKAARLLDEQLEQGSAADRLENEVAALVTERNLTQSAQPDSVIPVAAESHAKPTDITASADITEPMEAESDSASVNTPQAPVVEQKPNDAVPSSESVPASEPVPSSELVPSSEPVPTAPTAPQPTQNNQVPMNAGVVSQPDNIRPSQMPVPAAAPIENIPLFTVDEPEQARQISTNEANRILKIQDIAYEISQNEAGVMRLMIKGNVANTELTKVVIPQLKAVVYDQNDTPVARKRIILSQPEIDGNSVQSFFSSVVPAPEQVSHVEVVFDE